MTFSNVCIKCNIVFGSTFFKTNIHILPTSISFVLSITHFDMKNIPRGRPFNNFIENVQTYYIFIQVFLVSWTCLTLQIYIWQDSMKHGLNLPEEVKLPFILLVFDSPFFVKSILFHISHEIMLCLCIIVIYLVDLKVQVNLKSNTSFPLPPFYPQSVKVLL